jgi:DNA-binding XRE family transcriptional regulator
MSEADLAKALGVSVKTVYNKYSDEGQWRVDELQEMAKIFGVEIGDLVD